MDVTFTNVLEGARQYFQGLPTGSNSAVSPAYSSEQHLRHDYDRGIPPSSGAYWSSHPTDAQPSPRDHTSGQREHTPVQREHSVLREHASTPKEHPNIHRPSSHGSDSSSRPSSHQSPYAPNVQVPLEQHRQYYPAHYQEHYQMSQLHQQQHNKQSQHPPQQQHPQQSQHLQQPQQAQQHPPQQQHHPQPQQPPEQYQQSRQSFEFSRPQARETTTYSPYQAHISAAGSPYQQAPSPYQVPSPQQPRAPSREQMVPRVPSREQTIPRVPSYEQLVPRATREQQYTQPADAYYSQSYSYYQQPQTKVATNNVPYKPPVQQQYAASTQQQSMYYKQIYAPQQNHQSVFAASRQEIQTSQASVRTNPVDQTVRTTHNLPPIAAISNYHSSRSREPARPVTTTTVNRTRTTSSTSYTSTHSIPTTSSIIQPNPAVSVPNYPSYRTNPSHIYQPAPTVTTQSYTQVIMTASNSTASYYHSNQSQSSSQHFQHSGMPARSHANEPPPSTSTADNNNGRILVKRESPLDLSVKTVRTPADSTLGDADQDIRNKYIQNHRPSTLSAHNYPQLDVNSFQRNLTQRSTQLTAATAPKVEFRPNFNVPSLNQPRRPLEEPRRSIIPEKAHSSNKLQQLDPKNVMYRYPTASVPTSAHVNSYIRSAPKQQSIPTSIPSVPTPRFNVNEITPKRPAEIIVPPVVPNKLPKLTDNWRQSIDLQIEERLSTYKQQQAKLASPTKGPLVNGAFQDKSKNSYPVYDKPNYETTPQHSTYNQYQHQATHTQTYVPSPATPQYPGYNPTQTSNSYLQPTSRSNSNPSLNTVSNSKNTVGAVDKRVLSLLRNSLETKGQKKLEQLKSNDNFLPRTDIQHPSTDVQAPLQPKPAFVSRNNVSPFTPTSFPDNNMASMYKFHIPKAVDSINFENIKSNQLHDKQTQDTVITNHTNSISPECDGLAAFLAARIRTKGELKQGGPPAQNANNHKSQLQEVIENQLKSPIKQDTSQSSTHSSSSLSASPPKLQKERPTGASAPRKRLFSRNEEDPTNSAPPPRDPGLRSSSETSVFDFPDSDSENDVNRESLEAMRKCRKSTKQTTPVNDIKLEMSPPRVPIPEDDMFSQLCDNFLEQLKSGVGKRKIKKKETDGETVVDLEDNKDIFDPEIVVKIEQPDFEEKAEIIEKEEEIEQETTEEKENNQSLVKPKVEPQGDATIPILEPEEIKNEPEPVETESKEEEVFMAKRQQVRKRILSSSDSEMGDNKDSKEPAKIEDKSNTDSTKIEEIKSESEIKIEPSKEKPTPEETGKEDDKKIETASPQKTDEAVPVARPYKKPSFGDGSDFYPGWEEGVYKYKRSLRMPPTLISLTRPPSFHRVSTSLPDLDPCPQSPTTSISCDDKDMKPKDKCIKSEPLDSDTESNSSFNIFSKKINYDSEGSSSIKSLPNSVKEASILDILLEKCVNRKRKKYKRKDDHKPKIIPKAESEVELLATPSLDIKEENNKTNKKLSRSPVVKAESPLLGFRKSTISNYKDAFLKSNNILNNQFTTVVMNSRTRRETRVQKQRATIKEVFGEDRPASAPPVTCVNDIQIKEEVPPENRLGNLVVRLEKKDSLNEKMADLKKELDLRKAMSSKTNIDLKKEVAIKKEIIEADTASTDVIEEKETKKDADDTLKTIIKTEVEEESIIEDDTRSLDNITIKSETPSIDGDEGSVSGKKRGKFGKIRRKLSSGFDYIRKKKKVKKEPVETDTAEKKKKKGTVSKTLESVDDIQKEIKTWVLNKGIGETHLHRAARLGYTDVTAYCLEKMDCHPSPRDNAGYTPLHWACSKGHLQIAKLLLLYGANPSESAQGGIRPLHEAVENGCVEIARLLLSYGADPTLATYSGLTPLALTNDEVTKDFLMNHLNDIEGEAGSQWNLHGPATVFDPVDQMGYNVVEDAPEPDPAIEEEETEFELSESLPPNLYTLRNEPPTDRWVLLQDLSTILKIKSRDALLKQICPPSQPSTSSGIANYKSVLRELKMAEFLEQARCCQFLNAGEKINTRATKIALVKYTDKVKELLNIESMFVKPR
ncbi:uncharacterized protein [Diabrotica undecimpunctata]|uniref:uncharacterized protein n=1 Tax=Diabrotica undecimpunctata TaxID=50387 RepID=UPI003B63B90C